MKKNHSQTKLGLSVNERLNEQYNSYCKEFGFVKHTRIEYLMCVDLLSSGYLTVDELEGDFSPVQLQRFLNEQAHDSANSGPIPRPVSPAPPPTGEVSEQDSSGGEQPVSEE